MFNYGTRNATLLSGSTLLCNLQSITCGMMFNQGMANVILLSGLTLPSDLQRTDALEWPDAPVRPAEHHQWRYVQPGHGERDALVA